MWNRNFDAVVLSLPPIAFAGSSIGAATPRYPTAAPSTAIAPDPGVARGYLVPRPAPPTPQPTRPPVPAPLPVLTIKAGLGVLMQTVAAGAATIWLGTMTGGEFQPLFMLASGPIEDLRTVNGAPRVDPYLNQPLSFASDFQLIMPITWLVAVPAITGLRTMQL